MDQNYIPYSYKKVVLWILAVFILTTIISSLLAPLKYYEFRWLWNIGAWISYLSVIFVNLAVIISGFYTLIEFKKTKKYNWFWFFLGLVPLVFYIYLLLPAFVDSPD